MKSIVDVIKDDRQWTINKKKEIEDYLNKLDIDTMDRLDIMKEIMKLNRIELGMLTNISNNMNMEVPQYMGLTDMKKMFELSIRILKCVFIYDDIMQRIIDITIGELDKELNQQVKISYTA